MGITKLADLIRADAPGAISHKDISDYTGKASKTSHFKSLISIIVALQAIEQLRGANNGSDTQTVTTVAF